MLCTVGSSRRQKAAHMIPILTQEVTHSRVGVASPCNTRHTEQISPKQKFLLGYGTLNPPSLVSHVFATGPAVGRGTNAPAPCSAYTRRSFEIDIDRRRHPTDNRRPNFEFLNKKGPQIARRSQTQAVGAVAREDRTPLTSFGKPGHKQKGIGGSAHATPATRPSPRFKYPRLSVCLRLFGLSAASLQHSTAAL